MENIQETKEAKTRLKRLRYAIRIINRAAWERNGSGPHQNRRDRRRGNPRRNWQSEWE